MAVLLEKSDSTADSRQASARALRAIRAAWIKRSSWLASTRRSSSEINLWWTRRTC